MKKSRRWMYAAESDARACQLPLLGSIRFPRPITAERAQRSVRWIYGISGDRRVRIRVWPY